MKRALLIGAMECLTFFLATVNIRACSKGQLRLTLVTDALIAALGFLLIKFVAEAQSAFEMAAYVTGAVSGSLVGMRLTRGWRDAD